MSIVLVFRSFGSQLTWLLTGSLLIEPWHVGVRVTEEIEFKEGRGMESDGPRAKIKGRPGEGIALAERDRIRLGPPKERVEGVDCGRSRPKKTAPLEDVDVPLGMG